MTTQATFSFLTAGPSFGLSLPDDFDDLPELSSPLTINHGYGHRSFDFLPAKRDTGAGESLTLIDTLTDRDGRRVDLYERLEPPRQWYLQWHLRNGCLYTHLREEEGPGAARTHVASLAIVERDGLPPFLLPEPPLAPGASPQPGYQEFAMFSADRPHWSLMLNRPGYLAAGKVLRQPNTDKVVLRGGARYGVEVIVHGGNEVDTARELMSTVVDEVGRV